MTHPTNNDDELATGLRALGDDEGRPLPKTPEERLAQFRAKKRSRRLTQLSVAGVTAATLVLGGAAFADMLDRPTAGTEPAQRPTDASTRTQSPAPDAGRTASDPVTPDSALLTVDDLGTATELKWRTEPTDLASLGECEAPLLERQGYRTRTFISAKSASSPVYAWTTVGTEAGPAEAAVQYRKAYDGLQTCLSGLRGRGDAAMSTSVTNVTAMPGASQAVLWQINTGCARAPMRAPVACSPSVAHVGLARVGHGVVWVVLGGNSPVGSTPLASAAAEKVLHRAVNRVRDSVPAQ